MTQRIAVTIDLLAEHPRPAYRREWVWEVRLRGRIVAGGHTHSKLVAEWRARKAVETLEGKRT